MDRLLRHLRANFSPNQLRRVAEFLGRLPRDSKDLENDMLELMVDGDRDECEERLGKLPDFGHADTVLSHAFDTLCSSCN